MRIQRTLWMVAGATVCGLGFAASQRADAQTAAPPATPLTTFVDTAAGATAAQKSTGAVVQQVCSAMSAAGFSAQNPSPEGSNAQTTDLFLRCNELVQSAKALSGGATTRSLNLGSGALLSAVQQVSGVQLTSQGTLAIQVPSGQFTNIGARLNALRFGGASFGSRGQVTADNDAAPPVVPVLDTFHYRPDYGNDFYTQDGGGATLVHANTLARPYDLAAGDSTSGAAGAPASAVANPWGWFTESSYNFGHGDQTAGEDAFKFDTVSVTAGVDYNFGGAVLGASVGYDRYTANFDDSAVAPGGSTKLDGVSGSLFGAWFGEHFSLNGIASFGGLNSDLSRVVSYPNMNGGCTNCGTTQTLTGSPDGHYFAIGTTVGYDVNAASVTLSPTLSLNYRRVNIDGYTETDQSGGGLALTYDPQTIESFRSTLGVAASKPFSTSFGVLSPIVKIEWEHEFKDNSRDLTMRYALESQFGVNTNIVVPTDKPEANFGVAGVGLSAVFPHRLQGYLYYERLVGISYLESNAISIGVRGQF